MCLSGQSHVISGLVKKRASLSGELDTLKSKMAQIKSELQTIDNAILIFDPEYNVKGIKPLRNYTPNRFFESGERARTIREILRDANGESMTAKQVASEVERMRGTVLPEDEFKKLVHTITDGLRHMFSAKEVTEVSKPNGASCYMLRDI